MERDRDIDELRRLERLCLEQAEECATPEGNARSWSPQIVQRATAAVLSAIYEEDFLGLPPILRGFP
jgi:hypothetical protein